MSVVIKAYGPVSNPPPYIIDGQYLTSYDPEAYDGRGDALFSENPARALRFDSHGDALLFAAQVPSNRPLRLDGKPNKPLMAFTLEIVPMGD